MDEEIRALREQVIAELKTQVLAKVSRGGNGIEEIVEKVYGTANQDDGVYELVAAAIGDLLSAGQLTRHRVSGAGYLYRRAGR